MYSFGVRLSRIPGRLEILYSRFRIVGEKNEQDILPAPFAGAVLVCGGDGICCMQGAEEEERAAGLRLYAWVLVRDGRFQHTTEAALGRTGL